MRNIDLTLGSTEGADFVFYGGAREFVSCRASEAILHGPAETGKTISTLWKLNIAALKYPGASIVIMRKTQTSVYSSVLVTLSQKVFGLDESRWPCEPYGGNKPEWYDYPNGSRLWVAGMDKSSRILSAEHDIIFWNQVEEATEEEWEICTTRTTGRAGHMPYAQTIGDCNPAWPTHWMYRRATLQMFYSMHRDNPILYDQNTGQITVQGERTLAVLSALTGVRRTRFLEGKAAQAEGIIYDEWDASYHKKNRDNAPQFKRHIAGIDWGYRKPGCILVLGETGDGLVYIVAQIYTAGQSNDWWLLRAKELKEEFGIEAFVCDPSEPEYIDKFKLAGLNAIKGANAILPGINAVKDCFGGDRFFVLSDNLRYTDEELFAAKKTHCCEQEFDSYVWADTKAKEQPKKEDDHAMDALRYVIMYLDQPTGHLFTVLDPDVPKKDKSDKVDPDILVPSIEVVIPSGWALPPD